MRRARRRTGGGNLRGFPPPFVSEAVAGSRGRGSASLWLVLE